VLGVGLLGGFLGQRLQRQGIRPSIVRNAQRTDPTVANDTADQEETER
jgi:hypothetical protein